MLLYLKRLTVKIQIYIIRFGTHIYNSGDILILSFIYGHTEETDYIIIMT